MKCDKCGKEVPLGNDAIALEILSKRGVLPNDWERFAYGSRHLLPTEGCEGSPSRAQFLEGGAPDPRGYGSNLSPEEYAQHQRANQVAYRRLQEMAGTQPVTCVGCGELFSLDIPGWVEVGDGDLCPDCAAQMDLESENEIRFQEDGLA